jgi:SNF family Na+-dependent transporter
MSDARQTLELLRDKHSPKDLLRWAQLSHYFYNEDRKTLNIVRVLIFVVGFVCVFVGFSNLFAVFETFMQDSQLDVGSAIYACFFAWLLGKCDRTQAAYRVDKSFRKIVGNDADMKTQYLAILDVYIQLAKKDKL